MGWEKIGMIFEVQKHDMGWLKSHAMIPTPLLLDDCIRVYFSGRDEKGRSRISFADFDRDDPKKLIYVHDRPILEVGKLGAFDDSGTLATCALRINQKEIYIYYTAYVQSVTVPYRNSIGLAVSYDGGFHFERMFEGPILDRSKVEPYFTISPWVIKSDNKWHMWYSSATEWIMVDGKPESVYHIKYARSKDGINWERDNESCILPLKKEEANARPTVILEDGKFKMWFCYRGSEDFRDGYDSYRIGFAEASEETPMEWDRKDHEAGICCGPESFDNKMQAYPGILNVGDKQYLFYNGNSFGFDGFCCAKWE